MVGIDIVQIDRMTLTSSLIKTLLTAAEKEEYELCTTDKRRKEYLAGRFASKEAIFKATQDPSYLSYSILHKKTGEPYVKDHPEISISISHDGEYAIAIALIR